MNNDVVFQLYADANDTDNGIPTHLASKRAHTLLRINLRHKHVHIAVPLLLCS